jgi:hypothetical protein
MDLSEDELLLHCRELSGEVRYVFVGLGHAGVDKIEEVVDICDVEAIECTESHRVVLRVRVVVFVFGVVTFLSGFLGCVFFGVGVFMGSGLLPVMQRFADYSLTGAVGETAVCTAEIMGFLLGLLSAAPFFFIVVGGVVGNFNFLG